MIEKDAKQDEDVMLLKIVDWVESTEEKRWDKIVVLSHFVFAFLIFSPFFLFARYIVGSTDSLFGIFPNMLFNNTKCEISFWTVIENTV